MERVGTYATPQNLLRKSIDDLKVLKKLKLEIIYLGVETGDEELLKEIIAHSNFTNCFFTSNHASNYLPIRLRLPEQKQEGLKLLDKILVTKDESILKPEYLRAL